MAVTKSELTRWLNTLDDEAIVAIDEGGLTLFEVGGDHPTAAYLEVGGEPEADDDDEQDDNN